MLPPKDMVKGHMVKEESSGDENRYSMHPWHHFVDPREHLKGYKILDYLKFIEEEDDKEVDVGKSAEASQ